MMKKLLIGLSVLLTLQIQSAYAVFDCNAEIISVLVYSDGAVNIMHSGRGDYTVICNLNGTHQNVSPTTCAMWTSMLLQLKQNAKKANFYYNSAGQVNSCATLPTYGSAPAPVYIGPVN